MIRHEVEAFASPPSLRRVAAACPVLVVAVLKAQKEKQPEFLLAVFLFVPPLPAFVAAFLPFQDLAAPDVTAFWVTAYPVLGARVHLHSFVFYLPPFTVGSFLCCCYYCCCR